MADVLGTKLWMKRKGTKNIQKKINVHTRWYMFQCQISTQLYCTEKKILIRWDKEVIAATSWVQGCNHTHLCDSLKILDKWNNVYGWCLVTIYTMETQICTCILYLTKTQAVAVSIYTNSEYNKYSRILIFVRI